MTTQQEPKPDYTRLWNEYCKRTPLDRRMNQVEFIRWVRSGAVDAPR
jgi:hypothetical protein